MRVHFWAWVAVVVLFLGCRTSAPKPTVQADVRPEAASIVGQIEAIDAGTGSFVVSDGEHLREVLVAPDAEFRIDDFKASFEDLREGQRVRASLDTTSGQPEGVRIEILDQGAREP